MGSFSWLDGIGDTPACCLNFHGLLNSLLGLSRHRLRIRPDGLPAPFIPRASRADSPQSVRSGARLHCSRIIFNALQRAGVNPHRPWLANTFWQLLLSQVLF